MKKLLFCLIATSAFAQVTKNVGDFNRISVFDQINVELIQGTEQKVVVNGKRSQDVEVVNSNGELKIRMTLEKLMKGEHVEAKVYFKDLKSIDASEGSYIGAGSVLRRDDFRLNAKEGAEIKLMLEVNEVSVRAVTGGIITLTGSASEMEAKLGTGGLLNARNLQTERTEVTINTGGEASVNASEYVDAKVTAGGNITIFGDPVKIDEKTTLGGSIRRAN